jgi:acyl-CoA oxidase
MNTIKKGINDSFPLLARNELILCVGLESAEMAVVWAQLYVRQKHYGIHAFLVPLREKNGTIVDNVRVMDNGSKSGLNGVDNGRIMFSNKFIPRENLLNRYADVDIDGKYVSTLANNDVRFARQMGKSLMVNRAR